jgi:hypothetical protein
VGGVVWEKGTNKRKGVCKSVRPAYGLEAAPLKNAEEQKCYVTEMKVICLLCL